MSDAQSLTLSLGGRWYRSYGVACCPAHGDTRPSLTLTDADDGRLLLNCKAGCAFLSILDAIKARGLLGGDYRPQPLDPAELSRRKAEAEAEAAKVEKRALACWREALPINGTIAEAYLRGRGITCALPESLRFHPECWHPSAQRAPALVARIDGLPRLAVHRTYLRPDGSGKAGLEPAKAMLGAALGGAVRVADGGGALVVAEGVETALSLPSGLLQAPSRVWAALSTAGVAGLHLPQRPGRLTIAPDGDEPGRLAAHKLADRAVSLGWTVSLLPAPEGRDWNDILRTKGAAV
ncbi:toprim domain-containing protein [Paracoccus sp. (in: a-proteobacteria)]|uniref:DUF7146 domain-containing protein n=1 Tax=Paracoccus sp. TaxID=267 RepID=UPI0028A143B9|nr:toprim domain-containing protein [Paracoccus sp. (in: a-proteobacteria)]